MLRIRAHSKVKRWNEGLVALATGFIKPPGEPGKEPYQTVDGRSSGSEEDAFLAPLGDKTDAGNNEHVALREGRDLEASTLR